jgi:6-phosphogluconate dehydrogenase
VRSWLLELAASALSEDPGLKRIKGYVEDSGEGRWTVLDAIEKDVAMPVIATSLFTRFRSRVDADKGADGTFAERLLAALRNQFGGHAVVKK